MQTSKVSFGMSYRTPNYKNGSLEREAVDLAKTKLEHNSAFDIKQKITHVFTQNLAGQSHDVVIKTKVSKSNKNWKEKVMYMFGLLPKAKEKTSLYVSISPIGPDKLSEYMVRDAQKAIEKLTQKRK